MSLFDEMYYETRQDTLWSEYCDFLDEMSWTEDDLSFLEFVNEF